jgi:hypothetical protein
VWHGDLSKGGNIDKAKWYTETSSSWGWFALYGDYHKNTSYKIVAKDSDFLSSYLVGGQTKYTV